MWNAADQYDTWFKLFPDTTFVPQYGPLHELNVPPKVYRIHTSKYSMWEYDRQGYLMGYTLWQKRLFFKGTIQEKIVFAYNGKHQLIWSYSKNRSTVDSCFFKYNSEGKLFLELFKADNFQLDTIAGPFTYNQKGQIIQEGYSRVFLYNAEGELIRRTLSSSPVLPELSAIGTIDTLVYRIDHSGNKLIGHYCRFNSKSNMATKAMNKYNLVDSLKLNKNGIILEYYAVLASPMNQELKLPLYPGQRAIFQYDENKLKDAVVTDYPVEDPGGGKKDTASMYSAKYNQQRLLIEEVFDRKREFGYGDVIEAPGKRKRILTYDGSGLLVGEEVFENGLLPKTYHYTYEFYKN
jgi:hypothetical protein